MSDGIHPQAVVDPSASIAEDVKIGASAIIGPEVTIGAGTEVGPGAQIYGPTTIGSNNRVFPLACIGFEPQDLKYRGGETRLRVGDRNVFREFCTIHRGTEEGGRLTSIGDENLFMVYTHVAHDCHVGNRTIFSNAATLAGHVTVEDDSVVGAFSAVHQFCRVGRHAYIGGYSVITKDALPWVKTVGQKPACYGVNNIGLRRKGFSEQAVEKLGGVMRILLRSGLNTSQAIEKLQQSYPSDEEVAYLVDFLNSSQRGAITALPGGRRSSRGGRAG